MTTRIIAIIIAISMTLTARADDAPQGVIIGHVIDAQAHPIEAVTVIVCEQSTGIPVAPDTWRSFLKSKQNPSNKFVHATTDADGRFIIENVAAGHYRLIAQSWPRRNQRIVDPIDVNGVVLQLHGVANNVTVPSSRAAQLILQPLGQGVLHINQNFGNSDAYILISTQPPLGDPVLGFFGWGTPFVSHMIGGNRMPSGETKIIGLPDHQPIHTVIFANDNNPGFGAMSFETLPIITVTMPIVAGWSDGQHTPPPHIAKLTEKLIDAAYLIDYGNGDYRFHEARFMKLLGVDPAAMKNAAANDNADPYARTWRQLQRLGPLDRVLTLRDGSKVTVADVLAVRGYLKLNKTVRARHKRKPK